MGKQELCSEAIQLALRGEWEGAHKIVQELDGAMPAWIHAVLHKIEGDIGNSQYWYNRANRSFTKEDPQQELKRIQDSLAAGSPEL